MSRMRMIASGAIALGCGAFLASCAGPSQVNPSAGQASATNEPSTSPEPTRTRGTQRGESQQSHPPRRPREPAGTLRTGFVAVDGDTVERGDLAVRVIGVDTPEVGQCGYLQASAVTARFVAGGIRLTHRSGHDRYGRLLAYVGDADGRDLGTVLIRKGLANARYDSTDGYEWHPRESRYQALDGRVRHGCGGAADRLAGPEPYRVVKGEPFPSCDTAEAAGAAPLHRGRPGYNPDLDGDGDGVACE